jgi:hypothetical protein
MTSRSRSAAALLLWFLHAGSVEAQATAPVKPEPFQILDNSFLVEEAFNQDARIVQNIVEATRLDRAWQLTFTQEWPAPGIRHQVSYTVGADSFSGNASFGDTFLNYRFQAMEEGPGRPAFAPRLSAILPTGHTLAGEGLGGLQVNLPFSKQHRDLYFHWNGGFTWRPRGERPDLFTPSLAGSLIYRLRPMLNLMLESVMTFDADDNDRGGIQHTTTFTLSPGLRGGWNLDDETQIVVGVAMPVLFTRDHESVGVLGYFSCELPFKKKKP